MATLKFEGFLGDIPYLDATGLPVQNSRTNRDCWFVDGKLQPIKEALADGTVPANTKTIYRYRPCPKDASQAYWITRTESYNVAPSPIANDKYGRLYFTRKKYATGDTVELPHFFDVKQLLGRGTNTDLCGGTGSAQTLSNPYTLGVPAPATAKAELVSGYTALGVSSNGRTWSAAANFVGSEYAFLTVSKLGSIWLAGGYNGLIATSSDGETWTSASTPIEAADYAIRCFATGTISGVTTFIAGCNNGKILVSTNGTDWNLSPALGVVVSGSILAAVFWDNSFWIGTGTGRTYRTKYNDNGVTKNPTEENAWTNATGPEAVFAGQPITDAAIWRSRPYFVGGGGLMVCPNATTRAATTAWANQADNNTTGTYRSIRVSYDSAHIIAVTDSAYVTAASSDPTAFTKTSLDSNGTLSTIFKGAQLKCGAYGSNEQIILVGTNGAIAFYEQGLIIKTWMPATTGQDLGKTPLYSVEYADGKYVAAGGINTASSVTTAPRYYAVTMVDGYGAESAPALAGKVTASSGDGFKIDWGLQDNLTNGHWNVNLTGAKFYVYRTASSGSSTEFLRVDSVPYVAGTTSYSYTDNKTDDVLGEVMLSADWIMPPEGLRGLVTLPGGVLAGFVDNTLWFSEPGQPHAWPIKYQRTVSAPIVGLSTFANSVLITTIDRSYIASGIDPFNMSLTALETDQSCVSANSVVDMGGYAIYASPRGLVRVSNMNPEWLTKQLFTPAQWAQLKPGGDDTTAPLHATLWEGRYLAFFGGTPTYAASGVHSFSLVPGADVDDVSWYSQAGDTAFTDPYDDKVYFIEGTTRKIWNAGTTNKTCLWVSKLLQSPESLNFSWLQTQTAVELGNATVRYYSEEGYTLLSEVTFSGTNAITRQTSVSGKVYNSDGTVKSTFSGTVYDATARLPAGRRTRFHMVEIETNTKVRQVLFTQSALELRSQ